MGSLLEGYVLVICGGVMVDFACMDKVIVVVFEDMIVCVQPGLTCEVLNRELCATGLFFLVDFGANATLGGMAVICASGIIVVCYGMMCDNVLALEVVLADGCIICTGSAVLKFLLGYDLIAFFVGFEGTLGLIIELTLRLYGQPEVVLAVICVFLAFGLAVDVVIAMI